MNRIGIRLEIHIELAKLRDNGYLSHIIASKLFKDSIPKVIPSFNKNAEYTK